MPGGELLDRRGERWHVEGDLELLGLTVRDGVLFSATYPDALGRVWSALRCRTSAEVLLSAKPGYEFIDWGGDHHVGGGSHGSLHANDSLGHAAVVRHGAGQRGREGPVVAARHRADGARALRRRRREGGAPRARPPAGARACRRRPGALLARRYDAPPPGWRMRAGRRAAARSPRGPRCGGRGRSTS